MSKERIKLLMAINNLNGAGAQRLIVHQLDNFNRDKYELALLTLFRSDPDNNFFDLLKKDIKIYQLDFRNFRDFKSWFKVFKVLKKYQPQIVFSHLFFANTVLRILKPFFKYKVVIYEHNVYYKKSKPQIIIDKLLSLITCKIIAVSRMVRDFTIKQERISPEKFTVIPNCIDYESVENEIKKYDKKTLLKELGFKDEDKIIISLGRLAEQKNHKLLLESFSAFSRNNHNYKLVILGEGPLRDELNKCARELSIDDKFQLPGFKNNVLPYLLISEFYILTSKIEGLSLACLEAMAVGLPVISTNISGSEELIVNGYNGYLTEENKEDIAQKMQKIVDFGQVYFQDNCRATARKYDIKNNIQKLEIIINQLCRRNKDTN